ncbi:MAG: CHAP domain-containing protein [Paracoccaceae bacterium]
MATERTDDALNPTREARALAEAKAMKAKGQRVWCVGFARTASGVQIKGNAKVWWDKAKGSYDRGKAPKVGSVMAFSATRKMPMGHVAVVSRVVSERKILIDHANWNRNQVSLKMAVVDVSRNNDWSAVRVESQPNVLGSVYPVNGFIYPAAYEG